MVLASFQGTLEIFKVKLTVMECQSGEREAEATCIVADQEAEVDRLVRLPVPLRLIPNKWYRLYAVCRGGGFWSKYRAVGCKTKAICFLQSGTSVNLTFHDRPDLATTMSQGQVPIFYISVRFNHEQNFIFMERESNLSSWSKDNMRTSYWGGGGGGGFYNPSTELMQDSPATSANNKWRAGLYITGQIQGKRHRTIFQTYWTCYWNFFEQTSHLPELKEGNVFWALSYWITEDNKWIDILPLMYWLTINENDFMEMCMVTE